jgi:TRAP-type C4-dicarboxylate transport system substrate-binding protein
MKKIFFAILATLLVSGLILSGCSEPAAETTEPTPPPASSPSPGPSAESEPAAEPEPAPAEVIKMKFATCDMPMSAVGVAKQQWMEEANNRLAGKVEITYYPGMELGGPMEAWGLLNDGVSQMSSLIASYTSQQLPFAQYLDLPFIVPTGWDQRNAMIQQLLKNYLVGEDYGFSAAKTLWGVTLGLTQIGTADKQLKTLEDMEGLQLRTPPGPVGSGSTQAVGAIPVTIPANEVYSSVERGMVDGYTFPFEGIQQFKLYEVSKYYLKLDMCTSMDLVFMNLDVWNSLPSDVQEIFETELIPMGQEMNFEARRQMDEEGKQACLDAGGVITELTPEERAKWIEINAPVIEAWIADMDAKGYPASELMAEARQLAAE